MDGRWMRRRGRAGPIPWRSIEPSRWMRPHGFGRASYLSLEVTRSPISNIAADTPTRFDPRRKAPSRARHNGALLLPRHDGQNTSVIQKLCAMSSPPRKNIVLSDIRKLWSYSPVPRSLRRAFRDRHDTWCGMRWTRSCRKACDAAAYGQAVWSWHLDAGVKPCR